LNLKPGSEITFEVKGKEVVIKSMMSPKEFVEGFINVPKKLKKIDIKKLRRKRFWQKTFF